MKAPRPTSLILAALQTFANGVKADMATAAGIGAQPEDQLKPHVKILVATVGDILNLKISSVTETPVEDVGRPDFSIFKDGLLVGFIELKAPGEGTQKKDLRGRNRTQFDKFMKLPNLIYTDAREWTRYVEGERDGLHAVRLGDVDTQGATNVTEDDTSDLQELFRDFLGWSPIAPGNPKALAELLAPLTRLLRDDVAAAVAVDTPALTAIYADWQRTLFPEASREEFADSYAQTVTYGLLLAKLDGATTLDTKAAADKIRHHSSLLSRTLEILTQSGTREELGVGLQLLERTIEAVNPAVIRKDGQDPWLYFYEDFLAVYDPKLRNERGVYYTPAQVVKAQVALVDDLLRTKLNKPDGVSDRDVTVLDPAVGTGTYLLQVLQKGIDHAAITYGPGAVGNIASQMANNLYGFELLVGPYAVAHLRLNQAIRAEGGRAPKDGAHIYLTDTLESPNESGKIPHSYFEEPLAEEHRRAREVKREMKILVCIGNPPYEREENDTGEENSAGRWIRKDEANTRSPLETFLKPARDAGAGLHIKNLYNLYVYFWRWALWKVFEKQDGPGIVSFITASSYLRGPGFVGMREEMRRTFDEMWILDLGGDGRGTRRTENVFNIQTPVAIAVGVRYGSANREVIADVHYSKILGTRAEKYEALSILTNMNSIDWHEVPSSWSEPFLPSRVGIYFAYPELSTVFPWLQSGTKPGRTWVVGEQSQLVNQRLSRLVAATGTTRKSLFKNSPTGRKITDKVGTKLGHEPNLQRMDSVQALSDFSSPMRYGFRSFDRQWIIPDYRLIDRPGPAIWHTLSRKQIYAVSLAEHSLGEGPAIISTSLIPDLHHFRGSFGGKDVIPLYRDVAAEQPKYHQRAA